MLLTFGGPCRSKMPSTLLEHTVPQIGAPVRPCALATLTIASIRPLRGWEFLEEIKTDNIHLDTAATNSKRVILIFLKNQNGAGEAIDDFWFMAGNFTYRHHNEPRVKLYSPREESFPNPLRYIVSTTTHTNLDVKQEKRIDDFCNIDGFRDLSNPWPGFTQFTLLDEKALDGKMWSC